jgi:hypothetical protein
VFGWGAGGLKRAHCVAHELFVGPIPNRTIVRHTCDNPPCVNPHHLILGTKKQNTGDMMDRGRCGTAKLTESDVRTIRKLYASGKRQVSLAATYDVSRNTISLIVRRKTWKHI